MTTTYILSAVRTPVGRRGGSLAGMHPADLGAAAARAAVDRAKVNDADIDDVIFGCVDQVGAQSTNLARIVALSAGFPETVPGVTLDRQCGSSQQAVHFASQAIRSGDMDLVVAGGVEVMSLITIGASAIVGAAAGLGMPRGGQRWAERYGDQEISQFHGAELIAEDWKISRAEMEDFALASHQRAAAADERGDFAEEIVPVGSFARDETIRGDTTLEKMQSLPTLVEGGRLTAAVSSSISDGAASLVLASENYVAKHNLRPIGRVHTVAVVGSDPIRMLTGPIPATDRVLAKAGLTLDQIDSFEVNEAFASVVLAWLKEMGAPYEKTNRNGGGIALGHPLGGTGARIMTTLIHQLRRDGQRYGLQTMCEGGGMANATIIEAMR
jgi:acetyl-CoA C-acetyltransferase